MARPYRFKELERRERQQERRQKRETRRQENRQRRISASIHLVDGDKRFDSLHLK
jgi:hypothetical protein